MEITDQVRKNYLLEKIRQQGLKLLNLDVATETKVLEAVARAKTELQKAEPIQTELRDIISQIG
jgi:hypothetical protein